MNTSGFVNATTFAVRPVAQLNTSAFTSPIARGQGAHTHNHNHFHRRAVICAKIADVDIPKVPQGFTMFSEQLNGRVAMMGLVLGLATEVITGHGMLAQVGSIFQIIQMASALGNWGNWLGRAYRLSISPFLSGFSQYYCSLILLKKNYYFC